MELNLFLKKIYSQDYLHNESTINQFKDGASMGYFYVEYCLKKFILDFSQREISDLDDLFSRYTNWEGNVSKKRLNNLFTIIAKDILHILKNLYLADFVKAQSCLIKLMRDKNYKLRRYLVERYAYYFYLDYVNDDNRLFYRCRDVKNNDVCENCWHTPYDIREKSPSGRFGLPGYPILYFSGDLNTASKELRDLEPNYKRYEGHFKPRNMLVFFNLTIPSSDQINQMESTELINLLLTYPIRMVCTIPRIHYSNNFCEEYLFPQLLGHTIMNYGDEVMGCHGIMYSSIQNPKGINYAIPAITKELPQKDDLFSPKLQELFIHDTPKLIQQ